MDFVCYVRLSQRQHNTLTNQNIEEPSMDECNGCIGFIKDDMPLRATAINTLLLIPCFVEFFAICWSTDLSPFEKALVLTLCFRFNDVIRSPLVATCTFKVNNANQRLRRAKLREINRQREIQDALKQREERLKQRESIEMIEMHDISPNLHI